MNEIIRKERFKSLHPTMQRRLEESVLFLPFILAKEAKYAESWPNTTAGGDLIFQLNGLMEYIPCYSAPAVH
jgi:hypothetical protein